MGPERVRERQETRIVSGQATAEPLAQVGGEVCAGCQEPVQG